MQQNNTQHAPQTPLYFAAQISQFEGIRPDPLPTIPTVEQAIEYIKTEQSLKSDIEEARKYLKAELAADERNKDGKLLLPEYDGAKKNLPGVTWTGVFKRRTNTALVSFSGFLSYDVDYIDKHSPTPVNYNEMRDKAREAYKILSRDEFSSLVFPSVSATGVKGLVEIPTVTSDEEYKSFFRAYQSYVKNKYNIILDSLPDLSRLCFLSYCKKPYVNRQAALFTTTEQPAGEEIPPPKTDGKDVSDASIKAAISVLMRYGLQRELSRNDFVGMCGAFKRGGVSYDVFDSIMKKSAGYDAKNNFKIWNTVKDEAFAGQAMTMATAVKWAREIDKEMFKTVRRDALKKDDTEETDKGLAGLIEAKLAARYSFKLNEVTDQIIVTTADHTRQMSKFVESEIRCWLTDEGFSKRDTISDVLNVVAYKSAFNPIADYLSSLVWNGECQFSKIGKYFKDPDKIFSEILKAWMCGAVRRVETGQHHPCIIFVGKQGKGKSSFAKWLCSKLPRYFLEKPIAPDTNDAQIRVSENFIWEIGEIGSTTRRADIDALKLFISLEEAVFRRAHDKYDQHKKCIASFLGTVNPDGAGFLNDPTGHRRWQPVELTHIEFAYREEFDVDQLWAQAVVLYRDSDKECEVSERVQDIINKNIGNDFAMADPVEDLILKLFEFTGELEDFLDINDILVYMARNGYQRNRQRADAMEVARAMKHIQDCGGEVKKHRDQHRRGYAGVRIKAKFSGDKW